MICAGRSCALRRSLTAPTRSQRATSLRATVCRGGRKYTRWGVVIRFGSQLILRPGSFTGGRSVRTLVIPQTTADRLGMTSSTSRAGPGTSAGRISSATTSPITTTTSRRTNPAPPSIQACRSTIRPTTPVGRCFPQRSPRGCSIRTEIQRSFLSLGRVVAAPWPGLCITTTPRS